jgi:transposase-like protein
MTSGRWSEVEARAALEALRRSGEPVTRFAARHRIAAHRLYGWRRRLATSMAAGATPTFVEVKPELNVRAGDTRLEVVLTTGEVVRVPHGFDDVMLLRRVLAALRVGGPC